MKFSDPPGSEVFQGATGTGAADPVGSRFEAIHAIAIAAGETAHGFFERRETLAIGRKAALQDLVSEADRQVESEIRAAIAARFPGDGMVGEEFGAQAGASGYVWVVDPIDGTSPFLSGQPNWSVSIALAGGEGLLAGVVHAPALGETYAARRGHGAFLGERRLRLDPEGTITASHVAFGASIGVDPAEIGAFTEALYREGGVMFRIGSGALMLAYVAAGRLAGYYDPLIRCWDCYAGMLLVAEAGGVAEFTGGYETGGRLFAGPAPAVTTLKRLAGTGHGAP